MATVFAMPTALLAKTPLAAEAFRVTVSPAKIVASAALLKFTIAVVVAS